MLRDDFDRINKSAGSEWVVLLVVGIVGFLIVPTAAYFVFLALAKSSYRVEVLQ